MAQTKFDRQVEETAEAVMFGIGRFLAVRDMDGIRRTDATFWHPGTRVLPKVEGRLSRSSYRAGWQRLTFRMTFLSAVGHCADFAPVQRDVVADRAVGDAVGLVLFMQPVEDVLRCVPLLARGVRNRPAVSGRSRVCTGCRRVGCGGSFLRGLGRAASSALLHCRVADAVLAHQGPFRQPGAAVPADRRVQLGLGLRRCRRLLAARSVSLLPP